MISIPAFSGFFSRKDRWQAFDDHLEKWRKRDDLAPAYVEEQVKGLWSIQVLCRRDFPFGRIYRFFHEPPSPTLYEPFYNGWPGDHRGWMRFESKESAINFYKYATRRISFGEYQQLPHAEHSGVRVDLNDAGDPVEK